MLEKAASYPREKSFQANAYKRVAENLLTHTRNMYDVINQNEWYYNGCAIPGAREGIKKFIEDFIRTEPFPPKKVSVNAMDEARRIAAQNAPIVTTTLRRSPRLSKKIPIHYKEKSNSNSDTIKTEISSAENNPIMQRYSERISKKPIVNYYESSDSNSTDSVVNESTKKFSQEQKDISKVEVIKEFLNQYSSTKNALTPVTPVRRSSRLLNKSKFP